MGGDEAPSEANSCSWAGPEGTASLPGGAPRSRSGEGGRVSQEPGVVGGGVGRGS